MWWHMHYYLYDFIFTYYNQICRNETLCDVVLEAAEVKIPVHRLVLVSGSPYFYAMFTGLWLNC